MHHFVPNETVNKYQLLCMLNKVFDRGYIINEQKTGDSVVDRTLVTKYDTISCFFLILIYRSQLEKLKSYMDKGCTVIA